MYKTSHSLDYCINSGLYIIYTIERPLTPRLEIRLDHAHRTHANTGFTFIFLETPTGAHSSNGGDPQTPNRQENTPTSALTTIYMLFCMLVRTVAALYTPIICIVFTIARDQYFSHLHTGQLVGSSTPCGNYTLNSASRTTATQSRPTLTI